MSHQAPWSGHSPHHACNPSPNCRLQTVTPTLRLVGATMPQNSRNWRVALMSSHHRSKTKGFLPISSAAPCVHKLTMSLGDLFSSSQNHCPSSRLRVPHLPRLIKDLLLPFYNLLFFFKEPPNPIGLRFTKSAPPASKPRPPALPLGCTGHADWAPRWRFLNSGKTNCFWTKGCSHAY